MEGMLFLFSVRVVVRRSMRRGSPLFGVSSYVARRDQVFGLFLFMLLFSSRVFSAKALKDELGRSVGRPAGEGVLVL